MLSDFMPGMSADERVEKVARATMAETSVNINVRPRWRIHLQNMNTLSLVMSMVDRRPLHVRICTQKDLKTLRLDAN